MKPLNLYLHMVLLAFQNFTDEIWDFLSNFALGHIWQWKVEATWTRLVFKVSSTYLFPVVWFVGNLFQCWTSPTLVFSVKTYRHLLMIWYNLKQKDDKLISSLQTQTYFRSSPLWRPEIRLRSQANRHLPHVTTGHYPNTKNTPNTRGIFFIWYVSTEK